MLTEAIQQNFEMQAQKLAEQKDIQLLAKGQKEGSGFQGSPFILQTNSESFLKNKEYEQEVFGPATLTVTAEKKAELERIAESLDGQLTVTLWANEHDLETHVELIRILERKAGRLIINGFPTGVEVCHS